MRLAATILKMKAVLDSYSASVAEQYGLAQVALAEADAKEDKEAAEQLQQNWKKTVEAHRTKARVHFLMALSEIYRSRWRTAKPLWRSIRKAHSTTTCSSL